MQENIWPNQPVQQLPPQAFPPLSPQIQPQIPIPPPESQVSMPPGPVAQPAPVFSSVVQNSIPQPTQNSEVVQPNKIKLIFSILIILVVMILVPFVASFAGTIGSILLINMGVFGNPSNLEMGSIVVMFGGVAVAMIFMPIIATFLVRFVHRLLHLPQINFFIILGLMYLSIGIVVAYSQLHAYQQNQEYKRLLTSPNLNQEFDQKIAEESQQKTVNNTISDQPITIQVVSESLEKREIDAGRGEGSVVYDYTVTFEIMNDSSQPISWSGRVGLVYDRGAEINIPDQVKASLLSHEEYLDIHLLSTLVYFDLGSPIENSPAMLAPGSNMITHTFYLQPFPTGQIQDLMATYRPLADSKVLYEVTSTIKDEDQQSPVETKTYLRTKQTGWDAVFGELYAGKN